MIMDIVIGDIVSVLWIQEENLLVVNDSTDESKDTTNTAITSPKKGVRFQGTIKDIHVVNNSDTPSKRNDGWYEEKVYDILYDDKVNGKPCIEKGVSIDRIEVVTKVMTIDNNQDNDNQSIRINTTSANCNDLLVLLSTMKDEGTDIQSFSLSNNHVMQLFYALTNKKIILLRDTSLDTLKILLSLLTSVIINDDNEMTFEEKFLIDKDDSDASESDKPKSKKNNSDKDDERNAIAWIDSTDYIENGQTAIAASAVMLRIINVISSDTGVYVSASSFASDEVIEKAINLCLLYFSKNFLTSIKNDKDNSSKKGKEKPSSGISSILREVAKQYYEPIHSVLTALEILFSVRRQNDRLCILAYELALVVLRLDSFTSPKSAYLDTLPSSLHTLQILSLSLLRSIFKKYAGHRSSILQEMLPLFKQVFSAKVPVRSYVLHYRPGTKKDTNSKVKGEGDSLHVTTAFATLIILLQSLVATPASAADSKMDEDRRPAATAELSKHALLDIHKASSMFIMELMRRCSHKDTSAEYRLVAGVLIEEIFVSIQFISWPAASILLDHFVKRILSDLSAALSPSLQSLTETKKDPTFITFVMDLLGTIGSNIRRIVLDAEKEKAISESVEISTGARIAVKQKVEELLPSWLQGLTDEKKVVTATQVKPKKKRGRKASEEDDDIVNDIDQLYSGKADASIALNISGQILAVSMEALVQHKTLDALSQGGAIVAPSVKIILDEIGNNRLVDIYPELTPSDINSYHVAAYLDNQYSSLKDSFAIDTYTLGVEQGLDIIKDAYDISLAQWHMQSTTTPRSDVTAFVQRLITTSNSLSSSTSSDEGRRSIGGLYKSGLGLLSGKALPSFLSNASLSSLLFNQIDEAARRIFFSYEWVQSSTRSLLSERILNTIFERILNALLILFSEQSPMVRARVVRALSLFFSVDAQLISRVAVKEAVNDRFYDIAISVREEVVKLVGGFVLKGYDVSNDYLNGLLDRLLDKGVSVRKAVVAIIRDILLYQPHHPRYTELCLCLLGRSSMPKEEESIKDIVRSTLQQLWFLPPSANAAASAATGQKKLLTITDSDDNNIVAASPLKTSSKKKKKNELLEHSKMTAFQLVDVCSIINDQQIMVSFIRDVLHGKGEGDQQSNQVKQKREHSIAHCRSLVDCLIEMLVQCEEENPNLIAFIEGKRDVKEHLVAVMTALAIFSEAHPPLLTDHLYTILPYLKGDNRLNSQQEAMICFKATEILSSTIVIEGVKLGTKSSEIASDLTNIALKFNLKSIDSAVACLSRLTAHHTRDPTAYLSLAEKCFNSIATIAKTSTEQYPRGQDKWQNISQQAGANMQRCLVVLGRICEHSRKCSNVLYGTAAVDRQKDLDYANKNIANIDRLQASNMIGACYSAAKFGTVVKDVSVQVRAAQALCGVFSGFPRLTLIAHETGLLARLFSNEYQDQVHEKLLQSFKEMMKAEEERLEQGQALKQLKEAGVSVGKHVLGPGEADSDATVAGFVLQQHLPSLLGFMMHSSASMRITALELLGTILRQGMVCPLDVISYLVAAQGDPDLDIRREALRILQLEDEKHPTFVDNRLVDGVEVAFTLQMRLLGESRPVDELIVADANDNDVISYASIFNSLYQTCIHPSRKRRNDFLGNLLRKINNVFETIHKKSLTYAPPTSRLVSSSSLTDQILTTSDVTASLELIHFLTTTLAHLPYEFMEEPLQMVYWINRNIMVSSTMLTTSMKNTLLALGAKVRVAEEMLPPAIGSMPKRLARAASTASAASTNAAGNNKGSMRKGKSSSDNNLRWGEGDLVIDEALFNANPDTSSSYATALLMAAEARGRESIIRLKCYLKTVYNLSDERCVAYSSEDKTNNGATERIRGTGVTGLEGQSERFDPLYPSLSQAQKNFFIISNNTNTNGHKTDDNTTMLSALPIIIGDFNRLLAILEGDPDDFSLLAKKRKASKNASSTGDGAKKKAKPKAKKKKRVVSLDDDEDDDFHDDDDDDDEWA